MIVKYNILLMNYYNESFYRDYRLLTLMLSVLSPLVLSYPSPSPITITFITSTTIIPHTQHFLMVHVWCLIVFYLLESYFVCPIDPDLRFCYYLRNFLLLCSLGLNTVNNIVQYYLQIIGYNYNYLQIQFYIVFSNW